MILKILAVLLWCIGVYLTVSFSWGIRTAFRRGQGPQLATCTDGALFAISLGVAFMMGSSFHLLWLLPLSVVLGWMPFTRWIGSFWGKIVTVGIDNSAVEKRRAIVSAFGRLMLDGRSPDEAFAEISRTHSEDELRAIGVEVFEREVRFVASLQKMSSEP